MSDTRARTRTRTRTGVPASSAALRRSNTYSAVVVTLLCLADAAAAAPLHKRDDSTVKVVVPVVIVGVLFALAALTTCLRRGWHSNMARWTTNAAHSFGPSSGGAPASTSRELTAQQLLRPTDGARELTASQLAGGDAEPAPRTRRSRRANRRASQISTHSLPVYMKEPGEQEVIIYRGPEDLLEAPAATAHVVMPSVAEGNESPDASVDAEHTNVYAEMPESPHDMPLLADESQDNSRAHLIQTPRRGGSARPSLETLETAEERSPVVDPRGEAPPYFEVVPLDNLTPAASPEVPFQPTPEIPAQEPPENPRRRSLFGLFHGRHASRATAGQPSTSTSSAGHRRDNSNVSNVSVPSTIARPRSRAHSRAGQHRPSVSGSGFSVLSRSRSRLLDSPHLTSPSTISLNSISAPLTHTTMRTEFTYPRTGPTPEQIKLISSRESFARFGVPYGHDAIAFAANSSRMDLPAHPPPGFEEVAAGGSPLVPAASPVVTPPSPRVGGDVPADVLVHDDIHEATENEDEEVEEEEEREPSPENTSDPAPPTSDPAPSTSDTAPLETPASAPSAASEPESAPVTAPPPGLASPAPPTSFRPPSRASSFTSFATAEETPVSTPTATAAPTPYGSASSRLTLARVHIPDSAATPTPPSDTPTPTQRVGENETPTADVGRAL